MTTAYWCVLIAALMPYLWTGVAKGRAVGRYNNRDPRAYLAAQSGVSQRANAAQLNAFEAFAPFAAAVIIAHLTKTPQHTIDGLAIGFVVLRALYGVAYLFDRATVRSLLWVAALGCVVALFVVSA